MKSLALLFAAIVAPAQVVTVEPACPQWQRASATDGHMIPPAITIRYNPSAPGARFQSPETVRLILANAININRFDSVTVPLARSSDGSWQAIYTPKKNSIITKRKCGRR